MSADTTIVIFTTKASDGTKEYRVACVQAAEVIQKRKGFNREVVLGMFGKCEVLTDEFEAWRKANSIEKGDKGGFAYIEYGIRMLDFSRIHFPKLQ